MVQMVMQNSSIRCRVRMLYVAVVTQVVNKSTHHVKKYNFAFSSWCVYHYGTRI